MIYGIGIDIVNIRRINRLLQKYNPGFCNRILTAEELRLFESLGNGCEYISGRFAAKEAFYKATGGYRGASFKDLEVLNTDTGKPFVNLFGNAQKLAVQTGITTVMISISHDSDYAVANILLETNDQISK